MNKIKIREGIIPEIEKIMDIIKESDNIYLPEQGKKGDGKWEEFLIL